MIIFHGKWKLYNIQILVSIDTILLEHSESNHLSIVYGCFSAAGAELSSYEDTRPKIFTRCPSTEKVCLPLSNFKTDKFLCRPLFPGKFTSISPLQQRHHAVLLMPVLCAHFLLDSHISWVLSFSPTPCNPWSHQNTTQVTLYTLETLRAKAGLLHGLTLPWLLPQQISSLLCANSAFTSNV